MRKVKQAKKISSVPIFNSKGKEVEKFELDKELFTGEVNKGALYQFVRMYNANQRRGTASTKTRGDVSGGGKKPFRQKGTGRARAGIRASAASQSLPGDGTSSCRQWRRQKRWDLMYYMPTLTVHFYLWERKQRRMQLPS